MNRTHIEPTHARRMGRRVERKWRRVAALAGLAALLFSPLALAAAASASDPVQAVWKPVEIRYSYSAFTTAYNCDAYEAKVKNILRAVGAPPQTKVHASGCTDINRPTRNFFVTITTAQAVPESEASANPERSKSEQELIDRLGGDKRFSKEPFPAAWKTVDLTRDRGLDLAPGDCELMEGLRDRVFPKLGVKVVEQNVHCTPKQLSIQTPELKVSALMPLPKADEASAAKRK